MDENKFTSILSRAQHLMLDENFNRQVEQKANAFSGKGGGGGEDLRYLESQAFGEQASQPIQIIEQQQPQVKGLEALPEYMRESFEKMPPITGDRLDMLTKNMPKAQQVQPKQVVTETVIPTSSGIDYSLIKTIIDESVSRHLNTLNESAGPTMKGMRFINGNTFQFIDNKGNLYEGVLKLKKKAKQ